MRVTLAAGDRFADRFTILRPLASDDVFEVQDGFVPTPRALKVLPFADETTAFRRVSAAVRLVGPHFPEVLDAGWDAERSLGYVAMEKLEGVPLTEYLTNSGGIPPTEAVPILVEIAIALDGAAKEGRAYGRLSLGRTFLLAQPRRDASVVLLGAFHDGRDATPDDDRRALAEIARALLGEFPAGFPDWLSFASNGDAVRALGKALDVSPTTRVLSRPWGPPPPPISPPLPPGNPKGSFYDRGLAPPPPERLEETVDYRSLKPEEPEMVIGNPKGSHYDRGLSGRSRVPYLLVGAVVLLLLGWLLFFLRR